MKKLFVTALLALFISPLLWVGTASCSSAKCKVLSVDDTQVLLDCGSKAEDYQKGMTVKIKKSGHRKQLEGC
jgi:hypothetical protein